MPLCGICKTADFQSLLISCLHQWRQRQDAHFGDGDGILPKPDDSLWVKQYEDVFQLKEMAQDCDLCSIIFEAFEQRQVTNVEDARGLPIGFRPSHNKIEVCYNSEEGLIKLCGLDLYMSEVDVNQCFSVYQIKEDISPPILKMINNNPSSAAFNQMVSNWLKNCLENHVSCRPLPEHRNKPKRLIDVGDEGRDPFLVDTANTTQRVEWLSLSYCWGEEPSMKLTKNTMNMLRSGVDLTKFDATIRDAIFVTRALGIQYIWIDSICIIQDSEGTEWNEQASRMDQIYGESIVTLIVASSDSVMKGFLKKRQPRYVPISSFDISKTEGSNTVSSFELYISSVWDETEDSANGPWINRGWTMQEGLLPTRLLYYTSSQSMWKCCEEERFERGVVRSVNDIVTLSHRRAAALLVSSDWLWELELFTKFKRFREYLTSQRSKSPQLDPEAFRLWYDLIENYSFRELKHISDRLVALSGLARVYGETIQCDEYVAGLWKPDLIRGLMWRISGAHLIPQRSPIHMRTTNSAFPSWSWASVGYEHVTFPHKSIGDIDNFQALSRVEEVQIDLHDPCHPFGMMRRGRIIMSGPLKKLPILFNKEWRSAGNLSKFERYISEVVETESGKEVDPRFSSLPSSPGRHFAILQMLQDIYSLDFLVLEATGEFWNGNHTYYRVGVLTLRRGRYTPAASPGLINLAKKARSSLAARLGPQHGGPRRYKRPRGLIEELKDNPWSIDTVTLV